MVFKIESDGKTRMSGQKHSKGHPLRGALLYGHILWSSIGDLLTQERAQNSSVYGNHKKLIVNKIYIVLDIRWHTFTKELMVYDL